MSEVASAASSVASEYGSITVWLEALTYVGLMLVFALGFQSGQRYG